MTGSDINNGTKHSHKVKFVKAPFKQTKTEIKHLGEAKIKSPFRIPSKIRTGERVHYSPFNNVLEKDRVSFETSWPAEKIYFDPTKVKAGIVTCGGLCPGLNNVIRAIVLGLHHGYGVRRVYGIRYGLQGFMPEYGHPFVELTPESVANIHERGGTILGSSRGDQSIPDIVDMIERQNFNILFAIGGDGTLRAADAIQQEIERRGLKVSIVGVPKTIDNDISFVSRSFGFETAVEEATMALKCAHTEAVSYPNGIGLVKLMGRHSGFIAATAAVSQRDVNYVLIPEVDFDLNGTDALLDHLQKRLKERNHAVIVVAEGAGQKFFEDVGDEKEKDASGNIKLKDIGLFLKEHIGDYFKRREIPINLKYIDPSYLIRSVAANTNDGLFCATLGQNAVHAAMSGKTGLVVSFWNGIYCELPIHLAVSQRKVIHEGSRLWLNVLEATGQPPNFLSAKR